MSNPIQSVKDQLAELFNEALFAQQGIVADYTADDLTFADPVLYDAAVIDLTAPTARNSSVLVSVEVPQEDDSTLPLENTLHYNRLQIARLISNYGGEIEASGEEASTHDLLALLSAALGTELLADDIEDELLEEVDAETYTCTLRASATSLGYFGEGEITVKFPAATPPDDGDPA